jgi:hypothetical protein
VLIKSIRGASESDRLNKGYPIIECLRHQSSPDCLLSMKGLIFAHPSDGLACWSLKLNLILTLCFAFPRVARALGAQALLSGA